MIMAFDFNSVEGIRCRIFCSLSQVKTFHFFAFLLFNLPFVLMETEHDIIYNSKSMKSDENMTWNISNLSQEQQKLFNDVLQIMEKLNMLKVKGNYSGCFYLQTVKRDVTFQENSKPLIGIHFYFEDEKDISDSSSQNSQDKNLNPDIVRNGNGDLKTGNCKSSSFLIDSLGLDRLSRKQDNDQKLTNYSTTNSSLTDSSGAKQIVDDQAGQNGRQRGLSRTQVVVIATCSAVIGTFFIIAGAMRIHSCMKRYRANREAALVIARRSSTFGFGSGNLRRDSASSKASRQQSHPTSKNGSDLQIDRNGRSQPQINHSSPQHSSDHNPLLPVHLVGQLSDGNSSHGSLAFIDDESHSRSKQNDNTSGSEYGSEDDPLLRKSPDSGSSIDIGLEACDKVNVEDEHMNSSNDTIQNIKGTSSEEIITTPDRKEVFEPGGESDNDLNKPVESNIVDNNTMNENKIAATVIKGNYEANAKTILCDNEENSLADSTGTNSKEQNPNEFSNSEHHMENSKKIEEKVIPSRPCSIPRKQFSVDYFDVDDNGIEIQNPIFEEAEDAEQFENLSSNQVVTTGLTQSDSSLSNNPSYSYGNQTEYSYPGYNAQIGYCNPYMHKQLSNIHCLDSSFIHSLRNSELLSAESLRRENGEFQTESFDESSLSCQSSVSDDADKSKYNRMYSTDSYFANPLNKTSTFERSKTASRDEDDFGTDNAPSTKKPRIIPLHEYHRNSLKGTIDEDEDA